LHGTTWMSSNPGMERTAAHYHMFEGLHFPWLQKISSVSASFFNTIFNWALTVISHPRQNEVEPSPSPSERRNSHSGVPTSTWYVAMSTCRLKKLGFAEIRNEQHGPDSDAQVFSELKKVYMRFRSRIITRLLQIWLFDLQEVRPVQV
jgi:hypothetical protein